MSLPVVFWVVGVVVGAVTVAQLPCLTLALFLGEPWLPFARSIGMGALLAAALQYWAWSDTKALDHRSAFLSVGLGWVAACLVGALPLYWHPVLDLPLLDAFFEAASGFTTTGATVLSGLDALPRSVLLWRSLAHWLGGMGIVLLGIAVLPVLGVGGMQLFKAESPGPSKDKLTPRIAETAKVLWLLYVGLTLANTFLLMLAGMSGFDAICHAMATLSTGGFSTHDASLGYYASPLIHNITTLFMLCGGASFVVLHRALTGGVGWAESPELRAYVGIFASAALLITLDLRLNQAAAYPTFSKAAEHALFQAASILTTTGFSTRNFAAWPFLSQGLLLGLFFIGGMAGSTAGGPKVIRVILVVKLAFSQFFRLVHPRGVLTIKLGERTVDDEILLSVLGFISMWLLLVGLGTVLLSFFGADLITAGSATAVTLGNIGPGFGGVGPSETYAAFSPAAKFTMSMLMILGRLEVFTVLVVLTPGYWRQ